jgi:bacillithiol synthase
LDLLQHISLESAGIGGRLTHDYFAGATSTKSLYNYEPNIDGLKKAVADRAHFPVNRKLLYETLHRQYAKSVLTQSSKNNIELLLQDNTFTITTGHQLNLFTGPLYFIYKIASVISLATKMRAEMPENNFVPVYWMNSEDHDFAEINHFFLKGDKYEWAVDIEKYGPVGKMDLNGMKPFIKEIQDKFEAQYKLDPIFSFINTSYLQSENLAMAHRAIVHKIFGDYGLIILDQDDRELKKSFTSTIASEIFEKSSIAYIESTNQVLELNEYKPQVYAREINFFYTGKGYRERIIQKEDQYALADHTMVWTKEEMADELTLNPQFFSPNVVTRPMYQEFILPNIAYVGGPAEIAYWLQYQTNFKAHHIFYPTLILRDCFLILPEKKIRKVKDLGISLESFFKNVDDLINEYIKEHHSDEMKTDTIAGKLMAIYRTLLDKVISIDASMEGMVKAAQQKTINDLEKIQQKMNKALKVKNEIQVNAIRNLHAAIFPNGILQERINNFFDHTTSTHQFVEEIISFSNPLDHRLKVIVD